MANGSEEIIRNVATVLQDAAAALARLGVQAASQPPESASSSGESLAGAASALAQVAAQFSSGNSTGDANYAAKAARPSFVAHDSALRDDENEPAIGTLEFCEMHGLEAWVGEALDLLTPMQRNAVMMPQMNIGRARNPNGIVVSRIKQAVPLDQRLGIFVQINGLSEGVVDRISTLTQEQAEGLLDSGFKIQKAANPSAVAMKRISDVIRKLRMEGSTRSTWAAQTDRQHHGGWNNHLSRPRQDRSRTPAPPWSKTERGEHLGSNGARDMPVDVQNFMDSIGLDWWCGEVLKRLSLWQRQQIIKDLQNLHNVRNPSGVVMSRVRQAVDTSELMSIFIDLNQFDRVVQQQLLALTPEQQIAVISPGIYLQNVRNPSTAVRSRINNILAGKEAVDRH